MLAALRNGLDALRKPFPRDALSAGMSYLRRNPTELFSAAKNAAGMRLSIPLDALRWLISRMPQGKKSPKDVTVGAAPPAFSLGAVVEFMGQQLRVGANVKLDDIQLSPEALRLSLRVQGMTLESQGAKDSPMANLIKAMDLTKPGNLMSFLPQKPPAIVEASGDRFVIDLLKVPKIAANPLVRRALEVVSPVLSIADVSTEDDHLVVSFRGNTSGLATALAALRR
jgi:hypothetical protein